MTEQEAKKTTCHKTLVPVASADGSAPWFSPQGCIGSACSAWRWLPRERYRGGPIEIVAAPRRPEPPADPHQYWIADKPMQETWGRFADGGYCGLAGKP